MSERDQQSTVDPMLNFEAPLRPTFAFKTKPYEHQQDAFDTCKDLDFYALGMDMGTGKTKLMIDIASYLYANDQIDAVLVIAPNGVHYQWYAEQLPIHSSIPYYGFIWDSKRYDTRIYDKALKTFEERTGQIKWFCANVEYFSTASMISIFQRYLANHRVLLVIDEATRIKNPRAKRTKNLLALAKMAARRTILTGTLVTNSPFDLWSMYECLKEGFWGVNYFVFQHRYGLFVRDMNPYNGRVFQRVMNEKDYSQLRSRLKKGESIERISAYTGISEKNIQYVMDHPEFTGYKNLADLREIIEPHTVFKRKEDCLDLPPKVYERVYVEFNKEQKRIYQELTSLLLSRYDDVELSVANKVSLTLRLMQICGGFFPSPELKRPKLIGEKNTKIEVLRHDLEEIGDERVIIWAHFVAEIEMITTVISEAFPHWRVESYYGKTDKIKRRVLVQEFQRGDIKVLICNQQTASFGLNLQRSNLQYFYSNTYSLEHRVQAEDRSHRAGQRWPVVYKDLIIKNTVEERVLTVLHNKKSLLEYFKTHKLRDLIEGEDD